MEQTSGITVSNCTVDGDLTITNTQTMRASGTRRSASVIHGVPYDKVRTSFKSVTAAITDGVVDVAIKGNPKAVNISVNGQVVQTILWDQ